MTGTVRSQTQRNNFKVVMARATLSTRLHSRSRVNAIPGTEPHVLTPQSYELVPSNVLSPEQISRSVRFKANPARKTPPQCVIWEGMTHPYLTAPTVTAPSIDQPP
jgi:hypothetical protein